MTFRRAEAGFALPLAIFFMAILTLLLTAAFAKIQGDRRVADSSGAAVTALAMAQSGLQAYIGSRAASPPDSDSVRINVVGGYADVVARFAQRLDTLGPLYIVRSTGHLIVPTEGADPKASRTVAQFAQWQNARTLNTYPAVVTSLQRIYYSAGTVRINKTDSASCGGTVANQLTVRYPIPNPPGVTVDGRWGSQMDTTLVGVDWNTITSGGFSVNYTTLSNLNSWSTYLISGNATLSASGSGLLMVTGNLTITASLKWEGVILVGNSIIFSAPVDTVSGLVMTGLNRLTGTFPPSGTVGGAGQTQVFRYNSCNIHKALQSVTGFTPISNGWVENWATY